MPMKTLTLALGAALVMSAPLSQAKEITADGATRGAIEAAKQGPAELRRYVLRTRAVYGLSYWDFVRND
jgi:hypothetical protein